MKACGNRIKTRTGHLLNQLKRNKMERIARMIFVMIMIICFASCNSLYKAGNLIDLSYPVETEVRSSVIRKYIDTLTLKNGYGVPPKWQRFDKLVDLDSVYHKRIYFKSGPEEMYLLSFGGMLILSDVFNPQVKKLMSAEQEQRVLTRLKTEIIDKVVAMAKRDGLADSLIYYQ
jgi:hypothetical protein